VLRLSWRVVGHPCLLLLLVLFAANCAFAQLETATVSGQVVDPSGLSITGAHVKLVDIDRDTVASATTNGSGLYTFPTVRPGRYRMEVQVAGFKVVNVTGLTVNLQDHLEQNFKLAVGSVSESVTVEGGALSIGTESAAVSTVVDRKFVENMPLNGRSFQDLILLTPGAITNTPQVSVNGFGGRNEFSINGQRTESNYYTIDGVSGNVGVSPGFPGEPSTGGSSPSATALGTTQSLVSVDALEEFRVQSSTYSAEFGRNPGGQFSFVTRSGTNQWHGSGFDYLRNGALDANNWFNDYFGLTEPALRQNDFGGTLGGPLQIPKLYSGKDKTFVFFSYEGLRVTQPQAATINYVPDQPLRQSSPSALQPVLNAFPSPNGSDLGNGLAEFIGTWSNPGQIDSTSLRLDHALNEKLRLFFRFSDTSSSSAKRDTGSNASPSMVSTVSSTIRTYTLGATSLLSSRVSNDFRLNYSSNNSVSSDAITSFGGGNAIDLARLQGLTGQASRAYQVQFLLSFGAQSPGLDQAKLSGLQRQWNPVDSVSVALAKHQLKFGVDYRRLSPIVTQYHPDAGYLYFAQSSVQANNVDFGFGFNEATAEPVYTNFSAFAQDTWHLTQRLTLSMGLRWDVNPAPGDSRGNGNLPYTVQGVGDLSSVALAPRGTPLWKTSWYNFAPRLGAAYVVRGAENYQMVVRGGGGVFFDTAQQTGSAGYTGPGFASFSEFGGLFGAPASFPAPLAEVNPAIINRPVPPYNSPVYAFAPHLQLPYTLQWNASIEQALGKSAALTLSYVGAHAARLLEQAQLQASLFNPNFGSTAPIYFNKNGLTSDYDALQAQFQRRLSHGLQVLASYTWSHSIDYGSFNFAVPYLRGNSDFDVRHNFSGAFTYDLPSGKTANRIVRAMLRGWGIDTRLGARTGFPVPLLGNLVVDPAAGSTSFSGLDVIPGQPLYIRGSQCAAFYNNGKGCPGGRAINPNAFSLPAPNQPGNAPRNFARGFGMWEMELAVRREFPIHERLKLQFRAEAFNVFNHPSFGAIDSNFGDPTFGQAIGTLSSTLGGLSPLYQLGGSRSMQFALKLIF
jgi:carboxypeptidase family protein